MSVVITSLTQTIKDNKLIKIVDQTDKLRCFSYRSDFLDSPEYSNLSGESLQNILDCKGIILDENDGVVLRSFPHTPEYSVNDRESYIHLFEDVSSLKFFKSHEGCLLRMFWYSNMWYVSTHRKLNSFESRWGGTKSYGTIFKEALFHLYDSDDNFKDMLNKNNTTTSTFGKFCNILDKNRQYMFLLKNTSDNRIICDTLPFSSFLHVATVIDGKMNLEDDIGVPKPEQIHLNTYDEIVSYVNNEIDIKRNPGIIAFVNGNNPIKISNDAYMCLKSVRGNEPSINFRYLQLRSECNTDYIDKLVRLYPESNDDFKMYETMLSDIISNVHQCYMNKFVHRNKELVIPSYKYNIIRTAHSWFVEDRDNRKVTRDIINAIVDDMTASSLNFIIKRWKTEQYQSFDVKTDRPTRML